MKTENRKSPRPLWQVKVALAALLVSNSVNAGVGNRAVTIEERAKGADHVVVGKIRQSHSEYRQNRYGDQLIVTHHQIDVSETMKGNQHGTIKVTTEGGTVDQLTLSVSDVPEMAKGDQMVFFLKETADGLKPHRRGLGMLKLDPKTGGVKNTSLTVESIRDKVRSAK